jgi:D-glycero-beta-D-manno-heptose-7-phosphate kinase
MKAKTKREVETPTVDLASLAETVERFASKKVVLFGDFVADEFQYGEILRVSREAPVLILKHRETHLAPGGGANAANNLFALGAQVSAVTVVGQDEAGDALIQYFRQKGMDISGMVQAKGWTTPRKSRYLAGWTHTVSQQVLRVDREPGSAPPEKSLMQALAKLKGRLRSADAMAVSDYGFGVASPQVLRSALQGTKRSLTVSLDARYELNGYAKARITTATPNEAELEMLHHVSIGRNIERLKQCAKATLKEMKLEAMLVTRGRDGMALVERNREGMVQIPVHGSDQAVDVTGAGDTVLAAYTLALASGASYLEAAHIANIAGGLVVMKRGTATVSGQELLAAIRQEISGASC